jgi:hypothetical protein
MFRHVLYIIFFWLVAHQCYSQGKYDKHWVFGVGCHLIFEEDTILQTNSQSFNTWDDLSLSDYDGNLQFYFSSPAYANFNQDWITRVYFTDNNYNLIDSSFVDNSYNGFFFNSILSGNKHYVFYKDKINNGNCNLNHFLCINLKMLEIDNSLKTVNVLQTFTDTVSAFSSTVRHANGKDWWLIGHLHPFSKGGSTNNIFYRILIKENGQVEGPFYQNIGSIWSDIDLYGEIRFSHSGKYLAAAMPLSRKLELFDFDRCTGLLSNVRVIAQGSYFSPSFLEFSPNEKYLYVTQGVTYTMDTTAIYQFDLESPNTNYNKQTLVFRNMVEIFADLCLAPDGRIYITNSLAGIISSTILDTSKYYKTLTVIHQPDSAGVACDLREFSFRLTADSCYSSRGINSFPNYNLTALSIYEADAGRDTVICTDSSQPQKLAKIGTPKVNGVKYQWFPNYKINNADTSQPIVFPDTTTMYYVWLTDSTITNSCKARLDSVLVEVRKCNTSVNNKHLTMNNVKVYPNPAGDMLNVQLVNLQSSIKIEEVGIYDVAGKRVLGAGDCHASLRSARNDGIDGCGVDVRGLMNGLYFVHVEMSNGETVIKKLVIE